MSSGQKRQFPFREKDFSESSGSESSSSKQNRAKVSRQNSTSTDRRHQKRIVPYRIRNKEQWEQWLAQTPSSLSQSWPGALGKSLDFLKAAQKSGDDIEQEMTKKAYVIPVVVDNKNWRIVQPFEKVQRDPIKLPYFPSKEDKVYFEAQNLPDRRWVRQSSTLPEAIANLPGVKLLLEEPELITFKKPLLDVIFKLASIENFAEFDVGKELREDTVGALRERKMLRELSERRKKAAKEAAEQAKKTGNCIRTGETKTYSNYLLLDPRNFGIGKEDEDGGREQITFLNFIKSIFYIGYSGKGEQRAISHARRTVEKNMRQTFGSSMRKCQIQDIWEASRGVVVLNIFTTVGQLEARLREACLIVARMTQFAHLSNIPSEQKKPMERVTYIAWDEWVTTALGPNDLANKKFEEVVHKLDWQYDDEVSFGTRLLLRAYGIFRLEYCCEIYEHELAELEKEENSSAGLSSGQSSPATSKSPLTLKSMGWFGNIGNKENANYYRTPEKPPMSRKGADC